MRGSGRQPSRVSTASGTPQTASRVAQAAVRWETRGSGGWAQRRCGTPWTPGRVAEIPQNGQAGGLPGLTQKPGFGRFIVALERLGPTHQWPPWPRTSLLRWGPSGARPVRLIWLPPGGGSPSSGGSPRVRFPGQENQYQPAGRWAGPLSVEAGLEHADLVACQGWPGAYHVPFGGHQNEAAVDHLQDVEGDSPFLTRSRPMRASTAGGGYRRRRGRIPRRGSIEGQSDVYRMAGGEETVV